MAQAIQGGIVTVACVAVYLFLAGSIDPAECVFALVTGALATLLVLSVRRVSHQAFRFRIPLRAVIGPLGAVCRETPTVGLALLKSAFGAPIEGAFVAQEFDYGGADPESAARRAAVVLGASLAPRSLIVRGDRTGVVILHSLPAQAPSADRQWLA